MSRTGHRSFYFAAALLLMGCQPEPPRVTQQPPPRVALPAAQEVPVDVAQVRPASPPRKLPAPPKPQGEVASVLPRPEEERWREIPWRTNLMQARAESQRLNKPLFLWVMDGNPLGCT